MSALQPFNRPFERVPQERKAWTAPVDNRFELRHGMRVIFARRWRLLVFVLAIGAFAALLALQIPPVYLSKVTLMVESGKNKILPTDQAMDEGASNVETYLTQVEIMKSREVARRTVRANRLWETADFNPQLVKPNAASRVLAFLGWNPSPAPASEELLLENATDAFMKVLTVEPVRLSALVTVGVETSDRLLSSRLANSFAQVYIDNDRDARYKVAQNVNAWLEQRLVGLKEKLDRSEDTLQAFRDKQGIVDVGGNAGLSAPAQQMADTDQKLLQAKVRRTELESSYRQIQQIADGDYSGLSEVQSNLGVLDARRRLTEANRRVTELSAQYGPQYAGLQQAQTELAAAQEQLRQQSRAVVASISHEYITARQTERSLSGVAASARQGVRMSNQDEFQLGRLEREVQSNKQLYELLKVRAKETQLASDVQTAVARVVDPASPYGQQIRPNRTRIVAMSLVGAVLAGMGLIVMLSRWDKTLQRPDEAEYRLQVPMLATLPHVGASKEAMVRMFIDQPNSAYAEAIRTARAAVLLSQHGGGPKILLVTSSSAGEGATSFAANLALAHAQTRSTLLIDANLRNPALGLRFGLRPDAMGFSNLMSSMSSPTECIHTIADSNLLVMPAGSIPANPQELLLSQRFEDVLGMIAKKISLVIIDSPPMDVTLDATFIAARSSLVIYVVRAMATPYTTIRRHLAALERAGGHVLGAVLNHRSIELPPMSMSVPVLRKVQVSQTQ